jgi:hypothetical protein
MLKGTSRADRSALAVLAMMLSLGAAPAWAQGYHPFDTQPNLQGQVMGGYSATSGYAGDYLQGGWVGDVGVTYWLNHGNGLGLRADLSYSDQPATNQFLEFGQQTTGQEVDDGWGDFSSASAGLIYRVRFVGLAHFYGLAQIGISHVHLRLVQTFFVPGFYCDPYFGCYYPTVGAASVYVYNTNHLSWNVGLGVDFPSYWGQAWFIEAQYRRITTAPHSFDYWPIMVGLRF